jgi:ubiquinone/menaquinone biosynthesis C-methylase UbiE
VSYYATAVPRPRAAAVLRAGTGPGNEMSPALDVLSLKFVIWSQDADATALDIGCGDGVATLALLARGGRVVAVDPSAAALHRLVERTPSEQCHRLRVRLGQLPTLDFKAPIFGAIHAARVLHLLDAESIAQSLRKFYRWLYPEGRLFVSALRPLDETTLRGKINAAGFLVEESSTYLLPWEGSEECCSVIARCPS